MRSTLLTGLLLFALAVPACADLGLTAAAPEASLWYWRPSVRGTLGAQAGNVSAGATYADTDQSAVGFSLALRTFGAVCLDLDYTPLYSDSDVHSSAAFTFRNQTFAASAVGHLHYEMPVLGMGLRYIALQGKYGNLGVLGTVKVVHPDVKLTAGGTTAAFNVVLPIPMIGLSGQLDLAPWAHLFGSFKLLHLGLAAVDGKIQDWEAGAVFDHAIPDHKLGVRGALGYRKLDIDIASGGAGDIRFSTRRGGPFAELALAF